jgi:hypothetical protein
MVNKRLSYGCFVDVTLGFGEGGLGLASGDTLLVES